MKKIFNSIYETENNIINAFWTLYEQSNKKISVKEVADLSGYNRTTIYRYFDNTAEILDKIENNIITDLKKSLEEKNPKTIKLTDDLILEISKLFQNHGKYISVLIGKNGDSNFINRCIDTLKPLFYSKIKIVNNENELRINLMTEFTLIALINSFAFWYKHKNEIKLDDFIEELYSLLEKGILDNVKNI